MPTQTTGIEEQFALAHKVIDGRTYLDFADNHACLTGLFSCFADFAERELVIHDNERLTYGDVASQAARFAQFLSEHHNIGPGDRVGLALPNTPDWIISFVAIAGMGAVPVLINSRAAEDELDYCLSSVNCRLCITEPQLTTGHRQNSPPRLPLERCGAPEAGSYRTRPSR